MRSASRRWSRWPADTAPRSSSAASTSRAWRSPGKRKLEVAERSHALLTGKYGVPEEDLYFDPLVFPCASGDQQYVGSAVETIEGVRAIKQRFPRSKTVLGISNVSFGLPTAGREVLNSVFLYHCVQAGLDMALVNSEKLERYPSIPEEERKLSEDLLFNRGPDPITPFAAHFRERKPPQRATSTLPLEERLARYIIEGSAGRAPQGPGPGAPVEEAARRSSTAR